MSPVSGYRLSYIASVLMAQAAWTQSLGTVTLPAEIADAGSQVESVLEGLAYSEGPAFDAQGNLFFSEDPDVQTGRIWKITPEGVKSTVRDPSNGSNGLQFDPQNRLVICQLDTVHRLEPDGALTPLVVANSGLKLARVNDLSIASSGAMFFSNLNGNTVFFRAAGGAVRTFAQFSGPNGVEWLEEKSVLYVSAGNKLRKCAVDNATGDIGACQDFAGGTDGLTTDAQGNVYRASWNDGTIFVHDSTGKQLGTIAIHSKEVQGKRYSSGNRGNTSNCAFGGPDRNLLYITGDGGCYRVKLKIPGRLRPQSSRLRPGTGAGNRIAPRRESGSRGAMGIYFLDAGMRPVVLTGRRVPLQSAAGAP